MTDYSTSFWDRMADRYARKPVPDEQIYQKKLGETQQYLRKDMQVLEFGCGTGTTAIHHRQFVDSYLAIGVSPRMIEIASKKLASKALTNVTFQTGAIEEYDAPSGSFDAILGMSILHLLNDWEKSIQQVSRLLKPDGLFFASTPCLTETMGFFKYIAPVGKFFGVMPLIRVFSHEQLIQVIQ